MLKSWLTIGSVFCFFSSFLYKKLLNNLFMLTHLPIYLVFKYSILLYKMPLIALTFFFVSGAWSVDEPDRFEIRHAGQFDYHGALVWLLCFNITGTILATSGDYGQSLVWGPVTRPPAAEDGCQRLHAAAAPCTSSLIRFEPRLFTVWVEREFMITPLLNF